MPHTLSVQHIYKTIRKKELLHDVSLELGGGNIYGFIGENGSGKTMLLRTLSGLIRPSRGTVLLDECDIHRKHPPLKLGVIIENTALWPDLTGFDNLLYLSSLNNQISKTEIKQTMLRVGLDPESKLPFRKYSLGMKQRLIVAQAIMEQPDFLFLDEPTNAIDQDGALLIRRILAEEAQRGAMILLASHISQDISSLCTRVYRMENGCCTEGGSI